MVHVHDTGITMAMHSVFQILWWLFLFLGLAVTADDL